MRTLFATAVLFTALGLSPGMAQVPVIDNANLAKAQQIATDTKSILTADQQIMQFTQKTLQAVTGDRTSQAQGSLAQMALGSGFSMAQAQSLGSVISGGALSFAGMGAGSQNIVSTLINGLQLVQTITGLANGQTHAVDTAYKNSVNVAATLSGLINSTQSAVQTRSQAFTQGGQQIGSAQDLKGSVDQNTQVQIQTGQTVNELNGVVNNAAAAANQANLDRIAAESSAARAMKFTQ
ncbi:conjugal transfer protein [Bradyrhizobium sp. INPA01-394B]|uniref:Conjugal transfer protein n=1 Tax=Bradyrhizobium campsiandrae TaxID=1729892 RepID=A0ABR7UDC4_9BRAD|nr:type IV secretion system protein [Bradyrhizobium campsiandrae]MBC9881034.1 conjugal transfer protein [Bradyrhizobium campsiandrae]MBC9981922.1 conjugal transfer protein [Bradyrhizobium campsiandrae]